MQLWIFATKTWVQCIIIFVNTWVHASKRYYIFSLSMGYRVNDHRNHYKYTELNKRRNTTGLKLPIIPLSLDRPVQDQGRNPLLRGRLNVRTWRTILTITSGTTVIKRPQHASDTSASFKWWRVLELSQYYKIRISNFMQSLFCYWVPGL